MAKDGGVGFRAAAPVDHLFGAFEVGIRHDRLAAQVFYQRAGDHAAHETCPAQDRHFHTSEPSFIRKRSHRPCVGKSGGQCRRERTGLTAC